ncbi:MAG: M4 family metallopeptidase [Candidatus Helarchaeota archaeon]
MIKHFHSCDEFCRIIPPHMMDKLLDSKDVNTQKIALKTLKFDSFVRSIRFTTSAGISEVMKDILIEPIKAAKKKYRLIYDAKNQERIPGELVRKEVDTELEDITVNEAYNYLGVTYDFYKEKYNRISIDNNGMELIATVHFGDKYCNAFWNGSQMVFGDGDGKIFGRFTIDLDVIGHELAHGVTQYEPGLVYRFQPGALNESFSDVFGSLIKQYYLNQTVDQADWLIGAKLLIGDYSLRSMKKPGTAYVNHPVLGTDPQPATMDNYKELEPWQDNGGVHINSGIPNYAFYITAVEIGGYAWEKAGLIWYNTLKKLDRSPSFEKTANIAISVAEELFGADSKEREAVIKGWKTAGVI